MHVKNQQKQHKQIKILDLRYIKSQLLAYFSDYNQHNE